MGAVADSEGFEPPKGLTPCRFSRPVHSTRLCQLSYRAQSNEANCIKKNNA